ncbi:hypothetical protein BUALT_Bualt11G0004800 [Buddleja alternifolia]|uniref:Cupin type-1 domain-containing protein n=1 Tax=Buddleja alternifolia TaxID=168488 RepID=A0AAV6WT46_9LAMI|nr:hypothetical protein BUALT_Bualt11G0004800 [Buddleja alternifolia]
MELDLTPNLPNKVYGGDYYAWCPNEILMLREGNIAAAKLALRNNGFVLPRYSDSAKVAYVLQGIIYIYIYIYNQIVDFSVFVYDFMHVYFCI